MLKGPADPDTFRVKVGRYGDRWYHDPLPAGAGWDSCDDSWPSVSIVKNAWPKFLTGWAAEEVAKFAVDNLRTLQALPKPAAIVMAKEAHNMSRDGAAARGTAVHALLEGWAEDPDGEVDTLTMADAGAWADVAAKLIQDVRPEWLLSEGVAISRTLGFGGTLDAIWRVDGVTYLVDFKTRKAGKHGAYEDEGAQLGAYSLADYVVVERDGIAVREALPVIDAGLIVSIEPDSYRLFPVDITAARNLFVSLLSFWQSMHETKCIAKPIVLQRQPCTRAPGAVRTQVETAREAVTVDSDLLGDPAPPLTNAPLPAFGENAADLTSLRARVGAIVAEGYGLTLANLWPKDLPTLKAGGHDAEQLNRVADVVGSVEAYHSMPFPDADRMPYKYELLRPFAPDERNALIDSIRDGATLLDFTDEDVARLARAVDDLDKLRLAFGYEDDGTPKVVIVNGALT